MKFKITTTKIVSAATFSIIFAIGLPFWPGFWPTVLCTVRQAYVTACCLSVCRRRRHRRRL